MALPSSGTISLAHAAQEIGVALSNVAMNDSRLRSLAGKPSGSYTMADFYGKSSFTYAVSQIVTQGQGSRVNAMRLDVSTSPATTVSGALVASSSGPATSQWQIRINGNSVFVEYLNVTSVAITQLTVHITLSNGMTVVHVIPTTTWGNMY